MKRLRYLLLTLPLLIGLSVASCMSDDFTTSPSAQPTFSADTVAFDTVFTDLGTPTARLKVYNRDKKAINISQIKFKDSDSPFRFNVDGTNGKIIKDIEIPAGDSIYVFIECYINEQGGYEPFLIEDKLEFLTNGVTRSVVVEAYGQNVTRLRGKILTADMTLTAEQPYVIFDSLRVEPGVTLTVEPGARLLFHDKASLKVHGTLKANGEPGKLIQMRGDRMDYVLPDVKYDIMSGQWAGVRFAPESFESEMSYVDMRSTQYGVVADSCADLSQRKLLLVNSWLHNSQQSALRSEYAWIDAYGVCFSEAADAVVSLKGGIHNMEQCTIANYYLFSVISEPLLSLYHCMPDSPVKGLPLMQLQLNNSIIYGLASDINEGDLKGSSVYLRNVLLKSDGSDDDHFIKCLWGKDPLFYTVREDYIFNYRLRPESPAIGAGNPEYVNPLTAKDMYGLDRLSSGAPTLGAFVYSPPAE